MLPISRGDGVTGDRLPPVVGVVGRKNSGKTTLVVALAAELKRRGWRVASLKHGHHDFEIDQPGRDTWRHFHEGGVEAVVMASAGKVALVMRTEDEPDPRELIARFYGGTGYDLVLVEGYKAGPFPRIEVWRRSAHDRPLHDPADDSAAEHCMAMVTDATMDAPWPVIPLDSDDPAGRHVAAVADLVARRFPRGGDGD
jgi:molybdopterin-guanine dinucleotide biosynthesis protein B